MDKITEGSALVFEDTRISFSCGAWHMWKEAPVPKTSSIQSAIKHRIVTDRQTDRQTDTRPSLVPLQHSVARVKTTHFGPLHVRCIVLLLVSISSNRTSLDVNMFRAAHLHLCMIAPQTRTSVLDYRMRVACIRQHATTAEKLGGNPTWGGCRSPSFTSPSLPI